MRALGSSLASEGFGADALRLATQSRGIASGDDGTTVGGEGDGEFDDLGALVTVWNSN